MSWPFRIVTRRGDDQHSLSFQLRKAVHDLWMKWGDLHHVTFEEMVALAREHFPEVMKRLDAAGVEIVPA